MRLSTKIKMSLVLCLGTLLFSEQCQAFPPAPDSIIYGLVRDEYGDPLLVTNATIILETTGGVILTTPIVPFLGTGINYRLTVPMDAGLTSDLYKSNALCATVPFRIKVRTSQSVTNLPIQMQGNYSQLGQPAQTTRIDLTLGQDSVGDGLPDAWRRMILAMSNGIYTNINEIQADGHFPGNPLTFLQCYLAGTYPWDPSDGFALALLESQKDMATLQFIAIQGRTYSIQASTDLKTWTPVQFRIASDGHDNTLMSSFSSTNYQSVTVEVPAQNGITNAFYRGITQ